MVLFLSYTCQDNYHTSFEVLLQNFKFNRYKSQISPSVNAPVPVFLNFPLLSNSVTL
jgi:hypothetical protein